MTAYTAHVRRLYVDLLNFYRTITSRRRDVKKFHLPRDKTTSFYLKAGMTILFFHHEVRGVHRLTRDSIK